MREFCDNDPCDFPAAHSYVIEGGRFYLCHTCAEAFMLGQANAGVELEGQIGDCERCGKPATTETLDGETLCSECGADGEAATNA